MKKIIFLCVCALFITTGGMTACTQSPSPASAHVSAIAKTDQSNAQADNLNANAKGSLSPSAPINLTYQVENTASGQPQRIDIVINTRLTSGTLLIEVAKQEGAEAIGAATQRIDLASVARPITAQIQALQLGAGEHFLVLLLTVDTEMGPMSRSFRIDLTPAVDNAATQ